MFFLFPRESNAKCPVASVEQNLAPGNPAATKYPSNTLSRREEVHDAATRWFYWQHITGEEHTQNLHGYTQQPWENPTASDMLDFV